MQAAVPGLSLVIQMMQERCPGQPLNLVGYSHGGNVIINYLNQPGAQYVNNVVTLGTPSRADVYLNNQAPQRFGNFCAISLDNDGVQFGGAHPAQLAEYTLAVYWASRFQSEAMRRLRRDDLAGYFFYMNLWNLAVTISRDIMRDTRLQPGAQNFIYNGGLFPSRNAHTAVREVDVWRRATADRAWSCR
jgi:hypothetical protein